MANKFEGITVAKFIAGRMAALGKTANDIANEVGAPKDSVISMIANGMVKLPISLTGALARALDVDATYLLRLTLKEYSPDLLDAVENVLHRPLLSAREAALLEEFRAITGDRDVRSVVVEQNGLLEVIVLHPA